MENRRGTSNLVSYTLVAVMAGLLGVGITSGIDYYSERERIRNHTRGYEAHISVQEKITDSKYKVIDSLMEEGKFKEAQDSITSYMNEPKYKLILE